MEDRERKRVFEEFRNCEFCWRMWAWLTAYCCSSVYSAYSPSAGAAGSGTSSSLSSFCQSRPQRRKRTLTFSCRESTRTPDPLRLRPYSKNRKYKPNKTEIKGALSNISWTCCRWYCFGIPDMKSADWKGVEGISTIWISFSISKYLFL